jgi:hypothetical protein
LILIYNQTLSIEKDNKNNEVKIHRHKSKHRHSYRGNTRRNSTEKRKKTNKKNETIQDELNKIKIRHNSVTMKNNNSNKGIKHPIQIGSNKNLVDNELRKFESNKTINIKNKNIILHKTKKSKFNIINTPQTTKSSIIDSQNNDENEKEYDKENSKENNEI